MRVCPNCGESNGDTSRTCWKCSTVLGKAEDCKKLCPDCGAIYQNKHETCDKCGTKLVIYEDTSKSRVGTVQENKADLWMYIASILLPIVGIILGCVYIAKEQKQLGKNLIVFSVACSLLWSIFGICLTSCLNSVW